MSAFMVQDETISNVVNWLMSTPQGRNHHSWFRRESGLADTWDYQQVGQSFFDLNGAGVDARYGEGESKEFRALDYQHRNTPNCSDVQAYKSIQCLIYQCSEGNVPQSPLYKALEVLKAMIADHIISRLPEYEAAKWD